MRCPSTRPMWWRRRISRACLPAVALAIGCAGCNDRGTQTAKVPPPPEVVVAKPEAREVMRYLNYTGTVDASERVDLRARVPGFLSQINFKAGQRVKQGDVLFVIDTRQYEAAVEQSRALVRSQEAALVGAERDAKLARDLADQRAGAEIDAVLKAVKRDTVKADLERAKAQLIAAELNLDYCTVTAPTDGRITESLVDIGNLVGSGEATKLAELVQATPAYVYVDVSESDVLEVTRDKARSQEAAGSEPGQVSPGKWRPAQLALAGQDSFNFAGEVDYVDPQLNTQTGTLRVRTRFDNANEVLVPGFFARVRFPMSSRNALLVPDAALLSDQQGRYALVVDANNEVQARRVKIGELEGDLRIVTEGLTPEDRVVVLGVLKARPGSKVTPRMQDAPAAAASKTSNATVGR